ncbi:hypothetical protein CEUSTIGMA_g4433.t1 [Chlamydomonas eustigma]|uniref:Hydroxyproline O-arabinosyltransferase-like domain-containing protein n=1 Tax=Chlamydomonas eustigma TaxID=1157962 RepID=A0A250X1Q4_9CHLO|nr:hypothetical protein CEUSTIGMA_g4433.t1 [Chlamydomonas eustigma]|eukprot:GAX76986.1 hypothetical protein CEUSTIGMA_g4433.t1 [Chlamydomonas eustigma]
MSKNITLFASAAALISAITVCSLYELHKISTTHADIDNSKHRFATDFGLVKKALKKAWRSVGSDEAANTAPPAIKLGQCILYNHTDLWGNALVDGRHNKLPTAGACCKHCSDYNNGLRNDEPPCNVWVWCGDEQLCKEQLHECWLKRLPYAQIIAPRSISVEVDGRPVAWTSGTLSKDLDLTEVMHTWRLKALVKAKNMSHTWRKGGLGGATPPIDPAAIVDSSLKKLKAGVKEPQLYHTVTSVQGAYNQWQTRIHYYHFLKMKSKCRKEGFCEMGGFTRLLHSGSPDNIMEEIPTVVVDPMPPSLLKHDDYVVLNRPYAFVEWVKIASFPERYVLMSEPDHIFLRPLPNFMRGDKPAAFNFGYMNPVETNCMRIIKRLLQLESDLEVEKVFPIGNSPTYLTFEDMKRVMPIFLNYSMIVYQDADAKKEWGWVQEMYAFAMSMYVAGLRDIDLIPHLIAQPPFDSDYELTPGRPFYILHYTYGLDFNETSGKVLMDKVGSWHFDKREHDPKPIPRGMRYPAVNVNFDLGRELVRSLNEATDAIPCWNQYYESSGGVANKDCGEKPPPTESGFRYLIDDPA